MAEGGAEVPEDVFSPGVLTKKKGRPPAELKRAQEMIMALKEKITHQQGEIDRFRDEKTQQDQDAVKPKRRSSSKTGIDVEILHSMSDQLNQLQRQYESLRKEPRSETRSFPKISVSKFSGAEDLDDYLVQFEAVALLQKWSETEKNVILLSKLEGSALSAVNTAKTKSYSDMVICLKENFSPEQRELSLQKLQSRVQKKGENFSILAADIQRLALKAYPSVDDHTRDVIATDHFVNSILSSTIRQELRKKHPTSLSTAIKEARQILADQETESMLTRRSERAHVVEDSEMERLKEQICQLQSSLDELKPKPHKTQTANVPRKSPLDEKQTRIRRSGPPVCFHCQYTGHIKKWCPFLMKGKEEAVPIQMNSSKKPFVPSSQMTRPQKSQENSQG